MNRLLKYFMGLALILAATGCIHENMDDCYPAGGERTFRVYFSFAGGSDSDIDPVDVKELKLYVFDRYGYFVAVYSDDSPALENDGYHMTVTLDAGEDYRFVTWGNASPQYGFVVSAAEGNTHENWMVAPDGNHTHHLIYGSLDTGSLARSVDNDEELTVELYQDSYTISVTTEGITASDEIYSLEITDSHEGFSFLNQPIYAAQGRPLNYPCDKDADRQPFAAGRVYALNENSVTSVAFYNTSTGKRLYNDTLLSMIREANRLGAQIDFTTTHSFNIHLEFDWQMDVTVKLNGWNVTDEYHELGRSARTI